MKSGFPIWQSLFFLILSGYVLGYAPYGINETDGGFLTGLAWQISSGKSLYTDIVYVRPPVPVWLRYLELNLLPDTWSVLGERWIFYGKVALYSWMGAAVMTPPGSGRWKLALIAMVLSIHNYPPAAWHTVDGILLAVAGIWAMQLQRDFWGVVGGLFLGLSMLCKQSFYPLAGILVIMYPLLGGKRIVLAAAGALGAWGLVALWLYQENALAAFWQWNTGAASSGQLLQHGLLDYFRINPIVALPELFLALPVAHQLWGRRPGTLAKPALAFWGLGMGWLILSYCWMIYQRADFTLPFAQVRFLSWIAIGIILIEWKKKRIPIAQVTRWCALALIAWCAALSWGYNLPILFSLPIIWPLYHIAGRLWATAFPDRSGLFPSLAIVAILLAMFRFGYAFVYRDGPRSEMTAHLGAVFPQLTGIYSSQQTLALYQDLHGLSMRYPYFKTMPSFPHASYLTRTFPPLPMDWVVRREMNGEEEPVRSVLEHSPPIIFVEKAYGKQLQSDPELSLTGEVIRNGTLLEETPHFWVLQLSRTGQQSE